LKIDPKSFWLKKFFVKSIPEQLDEAEEDEDDHLCADEVHGVGGGLAVAGETSGCFSGRRR
jgi:hypothetical protein